MAAKKTRATKAERSELIEALDAIENESGESALLHFHEELVDGLHFLTEMTILTGYDLPEYTTLKDLIEEGSYRDCYSLNDLVSDHVCYLGMMCNCLKNKPWKQTNMLTDKNEFLKRLKCVWNDYFSILSIVLPPEGIVDVYLKKSQVNKFRQRSNY